MKYLLAIAVAIGVSAVAYAAAAGLTVNSGALQQGQDDTLKCTNDVTVNYENLGGTGNADIVVAGFNAACQNARFYVEFLDSGDSVLASCPQDTEPLNAGILITGTTVTITEAADQCDLIPIAATEKVRVTIVGGGSTPD